jgi:hypothetical protein
MITTLATSHIPLKKTLQALGPGGVFFCPGEIGDFILFSKLEKI